MLLSSVVVAFREGASWTSEFEGLAIRRHLGAEPEAFLDSLAKGVSRAVLPMRQDHTRSRGCERAKPVQEIRSACVSAQAAEQVGSARTGTLMPAMRTSFAPSASARPTDPRDW